MRRPRLLLFALCAAAAPVPGSAQETDMSVPATAIPPSFRDCASAFRERLARAEGDLADRFGCTGAHLEGLPGSSGSTLDMSWAAQRSAEIGDLYIDEVLEPELSGLLQGEGASALSRTFLLAGYIRSARNAGQALCELIYDYFSEGTIRSVMAGGCAVANRDKLIDELLRLRHTIG